MWELVYLVTESLGLQAAEERLRSMLYKLIKYSKQVCLIFTYIFFTVLVSVDE